MVAEDFEVLPDAGPPGTRAPLEHSGFDLNDTRMVQAFDRMGPGWREVILPRLGASATQA